MRRGAVKIAILSIGTRGDVQPSIALAKALQNRGHDVVLGAPENFANWVERHGLRFHALGVDMQSFFQSPEGREIISGSIFAVIKIWKKTLVPMMRLSLDATWEAARDADVIVYHPKVVGAPDVCEKTGAKPVFASPLPLFSTGAFPFIAFRVGLGSWLNRQSYKILYLTRMTVLGIVNRWRREVLGLGKAPLFAAVGEYSGGITPRLCAVSNAVLPRPDDMDDGFHMMGYWFLDEGNA